MHIMSLYLSGLLQNMRIGCEQTSNTVVEPTEAKPDQYQSYWKINGQKNKGLLIHVDIGDSDHGGLPLIYIDSVALVKKVLVEQTDECSSSIGMQIQQNYLLVGSEWDGGCSKLFDLNSGNLIYKFPTISTSAVWINFPEK